MQGGAYSAESGSFATLWRRENTKILQQSCLPECPEDVEMGRWMQKLNVTFVDTRDELERHRFLPEFFNYDFLHLGDYMPLWYYPFKRLPIVTYSKLTYSDSAISFHHINPQQVYSLEYLIYRFKL